MFIRGSKQLGNSNAIRTGQSQDSCATACAPTQYQRKRLCVFRLCALLYLTRFAAACPARSLGQLGPRKTSKRADGFGSRRVGAGGIFQSLPSRRPYLVELATSVAVASRQRQKSTHILRCWNVQRLNSFMWVRQPTTCSRRRVWRGMDKETSLS